MDQGDTIIIDKWGKIVSGHANKYKDGFTIRSAVVVGAAQLVSLFREAKIIFSP